MNELEENVRLLMHAVFGDPTNPTERPGVINANKTLETELKHVTSALKDIHGDLKRAVWMVLASVITGVLALIIKG